MGGSEHAPHLGVAQEHLLLSFIPVLVGLALALPIGITCVRWTWMYPVVLVSSSAFFAIPSLALFVFMLPYTGARTHDGNSSVESLHRCALDSKRC